MGDIVGGVLKTPPKISQKEVGWGKKFKFCQIFLFQISECMRLGAILISARGIGLRGAVPKKCHKLWEMSIIFLTPPLG